MNDFVVLPSNIDETIDEQGDPSSIATRMAVEKARAACGPDAGWKGVDWVLGADTIVVVDGDILGKPSGPGEARRMLRLLEARDHEVITGICLFHRASGVLAAEAVRTRVWMRRIEEEELEAYLRTDEPYDKAGAYAIQGRAGRFVERTEGSYSNVVGLPVERVRELLDEHGVR